MTTSTSFVQMANNQSISLSSALRANTPPAEKSSSSRKFLTLSIFFRLLLVMLLTLCVSAAWGADVFNITSYASFPTGWTNNNVSTGSYFKFDTDGCSLTTSTYDPHTDLILTYKVATFGSGTNHPLTIQLLDENGNVKQTHTTGTPTSSTYITGTWSIGTVNYKFKIKFYLAKTGKGVRLQVPKLVGTPAASCDKKVTVNKGTPSNGSFSISKTGTYETCADPLVITLSNITPSAGYQFDAITQTGIGTGVTIDQANKTVTYAKNTSGTSTINVTFEQKQSATITLSEAGVETGVAGKYIGDSYTLPSTTSQSCGDLEFVGWSTVEINNSASKPASNYYAKGASVSLKAGENKFYAVFAKEGTSGSGTAGWSKVTSTDDLEAGATYAISSAATGGNYLSTYTGANNFPNSTTTICKLVLGGSADAWTFKINDASSYNNYYLTATSTTGSNYLKATNTIDNYCKFSISFANTGNAVITCTGKNSRNILRYNSSNNPPIFACYSSGQNAVYLQKYSTGSTTTYSDYTTQCTTEPSQLATPTGLNVTNITSTSATLSWGEVANASSYTVQVYGENDEIIAEYTDLTQTTKVVSGLESDTYYIWAVTAIGDGTTYTDSEESETAEFTTQKACTDAVNVIKGTPSNGSFTMVSGYQSTCNGSVTVTLSNIEPATGYQFSAITQTGINSGVTIDNNNKTVTYAKNTTGTSIINVTFIEIPKCTVTLNPNYPNGKTGTFTYEEGELVDGNLVFTYDYNTASKTLADLYTSLTLDGYEFGGWYNAKGLNPGEVSGSKCENTGNITDNKTYYAKWSKLYTITLSENGTTTTPTTQTSTSYTLPTELSAGSCQDDTKELVGWSTVAIPNPGDKPTSNFYDLGGTVTLTADQTTFYAVFATPTTIPGGTEEKEETTTLNFSAQGYENGEEVTSLTIDDVTVAFNKGTNSNVPKYYNTGTAVRVYGGGYFTVSGVNLAKIVITTSSGDDGNAISADCGAYDTDAKTWTGLTQSVKFTIGGTTGHRRIKSIAVTYTTTVQADDIFSFSDYSTVCEAIPDPVWGGAVINRNSIKVDCGSMTKLNAADPNGPATISFPAATNHTLTYDITVTASEGFFVSTNKTDAAKYGASVTVSPNKTGNNAGKITQNVYVVAVAPAMSDEDFTGTITLSGKQLAENQVIDVTADVTCTTYTLTLDDRGTKTTAEYYAGASVPKPEDPTGVCTDPIHYVFDGWATATVTAGATTYTKVSFPHSMPGQNKTLYAVYRYVEEGSGDSGDYVKVTENLDDYSGDYLFVYETGNVAFDGGLDELDATSNTIEVTINDNTIASNATTDAAKFTIAKVDGGYSIQSASGYYIGWSTADKNGLNANSKYSANYYLNTISNSIISGVKGTLKYNKTSGQERFRYYQSGQEAIALYRKAASYLYTTSPVCGPHLVITKGKEIYVTGGNAQAARDLVMAQQKVSYKATRLNTKDGSAGGTAPDVVVADNGITKNGIVTSEVKVTFENTIKEQQTDGTYTITGDIVVTYEAEANNLQDDIQVQLAVDYNAEARDNFTVHARSLPSEFVIVAKSGEKWYALNADMSTSKAQPANGQVKLNDPDNPTEATYAPCNAIYTFEAMPQGAADRISVRFIGMENKYLWSASEGNTGIQNNSKDPAANALAYNWKLYTEDNIAYHFGNAQNTRMLGLHSTNVAFGMYANGASVVQDIRILPYVEKCLYNYAPSNLKVSVLKGSYVTLTWDAVAGATKYQYSTDATNWTDAGTEPTVTINGLEGNTKYTYYLRAYHEDVGVNQECIDYAKITFTTANCDDVPTDITYTADLNSITVSWTAAAPTATIKLYLDENGEHAIFTQDGTKSPWKISTLSKNTTYYLQIFSNGTCASPIVPVKTEDVEVDIVEWQPQGIVVDINTNESVKVTLENEVAFGTGVGKKAEDIFFSKYFEANGTAKILAIYNGTDEKIDLSTVSILNDLSSQSLDLAEFGHKEVGYIYPNEEIILFNKGVETVTECSKQQDSYPDWYNVEHGVLNFGGRATLILKRGDAVIDIIGSIETQGTNYPNDLVGTTIYNIAKSPTGENEKPSWGDDPGWVCESGDNIMTDVEETDYPLSTNRCLLVRKNTVISGVNAVAKNINKVFATLCDEWVGLQIPKNAPSTDDGVTESCEGMAFVGDFDYSDYYTKYVSMGEGTTFDENDRNPDGTVTIPITDLYKHACSNIRVKLTNSNGDVLTDREYKVPIMITSDQGTDGQTFLDLQQNLATKEVDGDGNVINTYPLSLDEVREICKTCDVVVRDNATLTKVTDGTNNDHPQVRNVYVYEGASIVIPDGENHNYTINGLSLRRKGDVVASAQVQGTGKFVLPADEPVCLDLRVDANNWHWFTLPFDCLIEDVTWVDGTPAKYNTDWFLMYYDGESRAASTNPYDNHWKVYSGTTIEAGKGYIVGITGDLAHPDYTFELRFPMAQGVLTAEKDDKEVAVNAWGVKSDNKPNNLGWNLVGNPYLNYYKTADEDEYSPLAGLPLIHYTNTDPVTGEWYYENSGSVPYVATPIEGGWYEYRQELASEVNMMPFTAYFVQVGDPNNQDHTNGEELNASFKAINRGKKSIVRRAPREVEEIEEPIIVRVELTNSKGESDKTSLVIDQRFTNEYEMNGDFFKWFGDYYNYYTKPVLYTIGADQGKRAFNALNEQLATQPIPVGMYAAQAGNYTFSLNQQFDLSRVEEVWLYDATQSTYTNLMQSDYTFSTSKVNGAGRFSLSVKLAPKVATGMENVNADKVWATTQNQQIIVNGLENNTQLWIYDAAGKLVQMDNTQYYQHRYSVPQVGTYFIALQKGTTKQTIKVVVE